MSPFANVVFLLLVATATSAYAVSSEKSFNDAVDSSIAKVNIDYNEAKVELDSLISQIESGKPEQLDSSSKDENVERIEIGYAFQLGARQQEYSIRTKSQAPSTECREFLKKHAATSKPQYIECSKSYLLSMKNQHPHLKETLETALASVAAQNDKVKGCLSRRSSYVPASVRIVWCYFNEKSKLSSTAKAAKTQFLATIENSRKIVNSWILNAGHCVALAENPKPMTEWSKACESSTQPNTVKNPTRPRVVYH